MKWLLLIFSLFKPLFSPLYPPESLNPIDEIKDLIRKNAAKVAMLLFSSIALSILFTSGIMMIAMNMSAQYDLNSSIYFNTMIGTGIGLASLSFLIATLSIRSFHNSFGKKMEDVKKDQALSGIGMTHPLQDALALLIADFIKERELKRSNQVSNQKESHYENQLNIKTAQVREEQEIQKH
jgi:hypothetical protein